MNFSLTGFDNPVTTSVGSLLANLPELLGAMSTEPAHFVMVAEFSDGRYFQVWSDPFGNVNGEVLSNLNIGDLIALSPEDEQELRRLGFEEPSTYLSPNFSFEATTPSERLQLLAMLISAVLDVLGEDMNNAVEVRTWQIEVPESATKNTIRCNARVYLE